MLEPELPLYYILDRGFPEEGIEEMVRVLGIHPVQCAVIFSVRNAQLASRISPNVIRRSNEKAAIATANEIASQSGIPTLVVGTAMVLDAVFADGHKEQVIANA